MAVVSKDVRLLKGRRVGKKRHVPRVTKGAALSMRIAARLNELLGDRPASYLAAKLGVSVDAVTKWLHAHRTPDVDKWDQIAVALGGKSFRDILPE